MPDGERLQVTGTDNGTARLTVDTVLQYLWRHHLLDASELLESTVRATEMSRRNRNFVVTRRARSGYLVKHAASEWLILERTLPREAEFYRFCQSDVRAAALSRHLPQLEHAAVAVLVSRLIEGAQPLWAFYGRSHQGALWTAAASLGHSLALLHAIGKPTDASVSELRASIPAARPWAFALHQPPPEILSVLSAANFTLLRIIRDESELARHLDHAAATWRSECLVHGDIKSDNLLVSTNGAVQELHLVDWELVHFGDPAWDIACAYYDFLWPWLAPVAWLAQPALGSATFPIQHAQIALQAMCSAYRSTAGLSEADARTRLERAVEFCAVRMVQAAYEHAQEAASAPPISILLLQLAENVFGAPELAMTRLLGLGNGVA